MQQCRAYAGKMLSYMQPVWTCRVSGESGRTLRGALRSEAWEAGELFAVEGGSALRRWIPALLPHIHGCTMPIQALVDALAEAYVNRFITGERVLLVSHAVGWAPPSFDKGATPAPPIMKASSVRLSDAKNTVYPVTVISISVPNPTNPHNIIYKVRVDAPLHERAWARKDGVPPGTPPPKKGAVILVKGSTLSRKRLPFTKDILKKLIRVVATRLSYTNAPFVVHEPIVKRYSLPPLPPAMAEIELAARAKHMVPKTPAGSKRPGSGPGGDAPSAKRKKSGLTPEEREARKAKAAAERAAAPKYPMEDTLVPRDPATIEKEGIVPIVVTGPPDGSRDFPYPRGDVGDVLETWDWFVTFSKVISLTPFSLDDWENVLTNTTEVIPLNFEAIRSLLDIIFGDFAGRLSDAEKQLKSMRMNGRTWESALIAYLRERQLHITSERLPEDLVDRFDSVGYSQLSVADKTAIFSFLQGEALDSAYLTEAVETSMETVQELNRAVYQAKLESSRRLKAAKEREKRQVESMNLMAEPESPTSGPDSARATPLDGDLLEADRYERSSSRRAALAEKKRREEEEDARRRELRAQQNALNNIKREISDAKDLKRKREEQAVRAGRSSLVRTSPVGYDRYHRSYWWFAGDTGRLFQYDARGAKTPGSGTWKYFSDGPSLQTLYDSLDKRGVREAALIEWLDKYWDEVVSNMLVRNRELGLVDEEITPVSTRRNSRSAVDRERGYMRYTNRYR